STARWARIRPVSTPASTSITLQPVTFTPWARASRTPWAPGKAGSRAGWVLMIRPPKASSSGGPTSFMNPASTTSCGPWPAVGAGAGGQRGGVGVDGPAAEGLGRRRADELHESGEHHGLRVVAGDGGSEGAVPARAIGMVAQGDHLGGYAGGAGVLEAGGL